MYAGFCWYERPSSFCFKKSFTAILAFHSLLPFSPLPVWGFWYALTFKVPPVSLHAHLLDYLRLSCSHMCMHISYSAYSSDGSHKKAFNSPKVNIFIY